MIRKLRLKVELNLKIKSIRRKEIIKRVMGLDSMLMIDRLIRV